MTRKRAGRILMIAGLLFFLVSVLLIISNDIYEWQTNSNGFRGKYDTLFDLIYSREKGGLLISVIGGLIPASVGFFLYRGKNKA